MKITLFVAKSGRCPVKKWINNLPVKNRALVLASLKSIEELGFDSLRVKFRHIKGKLWEIKIQAGVGYRIFYVTVKSDSLILLHAYQKQSQKAPKKEIRIAEKRLKEVLGYESYYA